MSWPAAEVDIDEPLVRDLLEQQHPDLAGLILHEVGFGFDNSLWRLGFDLLLRLPRRLMGAELVENEQRWLPLFPTAAAIADSDRGYFPGQRVARGVRVLAPVIKAN